MYFVSNPTSQSVEALCTFRVSGKQPEMWDAMTGEQRELPQSELGNQKSKIYLDLGKVAIMATVKLNGKELSTLWKAPCRVDICDAAKPGRNVLEIRVVNLLVNRMIGDQFLPEDSERTTGHGAGVLKDMKWPQWVEEGKPSPTGRYTFSTWRGWKKADPLQESGLLGPVTVRMALRLE